MNPIDYTAQVQDPLDSAIKGYQFGAAIRNDRQAQDAAALKQRQQQEMQADLSELANNQNATGEDYLKLMGKHPSMYKQVKDQFDFMDSAKKEQGFDEMTKLYTYVSTGDTQSAQKALEERFAAAKKTGDVKSAAGTKSMMKILRANPKAAKDSIGMMLAATMGKEKFMETLTKMEQLGFDKQNNPYKLDQSKVNVEKTEREIDNIESVTTERESLLGGKVAQQGATLEKTKADTIATIGGEQRAQQMQPLELKKALASIGLTKAQTNSAYMSARKAQADINKINTEAKRIAAGGVIDPDKMFETEKKLRDEYVKNTKNFSTVRESYRRIKASDDNAAGDLALIFNYMKMLDPGSTVREGEFATAQNAAGVPERIRNQVNNWKTGERLSEAQRNEFKTQSDKLYKASKVSEGEVRGGITRVADNYRLNKDNIFYTDKIEAPKKIVVDY